MCVKNFFPTYGSRQRKGTLSSAYDLSEDSKPAIIIDSLSLTRIVVVDSRFFTQGIVLSGPIKSYIELTSGVTEVVIYPSVLTFGCISNLIPISSL